MKRWLSVLFALGTALGVILFTLVAIFHLQLSTLDVAASPVAAQPLSSPSVNGSSGSFSDAEAYFKARGITLSVQPPVTLAWASWTSLAPSGANAGQAATEIASEWQKYSDTTLKNSGLQAIYLVKDLKVDGQARSGMPDPEITHALYFDVSTQYLTSENGSYLRRTFHHEFSHLIEYDLFGSYAPKDTAWLHCNASGTVYGNGGAQMYSDPDYAHKMHPKTGFIDGYATSGVEEDKAELFAYLKIDPSYVQTTAKNDASVACKLRLTESLLQTLDR